MALVSFQAKLCHLAALAASASLGWPDQERSPWARSGCHPKTFISEASCDAWLAPNPTRLQFTDTYGNCMQLQCCLSNSAAQHCNLVLVGNQGPNETKLPLTLSILRLDASENGATSKPWRLVEGAMLKTDIDGTPTVVLRSLRSIVTLIIFDDDVADLHWTKAKHGTPICSLWESSLAILGNKMLLLYDGGQICNRE